MARIEMNFDSMNRRVVITGMGVIAANGKDLQTFWSSIRDGVSAAVPVSRFDTRNAPTKIAAEIQDFAPSRYMDQKTERRLDRSLQYSVAAARMAADDAGLDLTRFDADRVGVIEGTSLSNNDTAARMEQAYTAKGYRGV